MAKSGGEYFKERLRQSFEFTWWHDVMVAAIGCLIGYVVLEHKAAWENVIALVVIGLGATVVFEIGKTAYRFVWTIPRESDRKMDEAFDSIPRLVQSGISYLPTNVGADFYHLRIANEPNGVVGRQTAESLAGTVEICDEQGRSLAPERIHRWAASAQIPGLPNRADLELAINIDPNGISHPFDLALKFDGDSAFYTHNNESVAKYGYRDPTYGFDPGTYIATVKIRGKNIGITAFRCRIVNRGVNEKLQITVL